MRDLLEVQTHEILGRSPALLDRRDHVLKLALAEAAEEPHDFRSRSPARVPLEGGRIGRDGAARRREGDDHRRSSPAMSS